MNKLVKVFGDPLEDSTCTFKRALSMLGCAPSTLAAYAKRYPETVVSTGSTRADLVFHTRDLVGGGKLWNVYQVGKLKNSQIAEVASEQKKEEASLKPGNLEAVVASTSVDTTKTPPTMKAVVLFGSVEDVMEAVKSL